MCLDPQKIIEEQFIDEIKGIIKKSGIFLGLSDDFKIVITNAKSYITMPFHYKVIMKKYHISAGVDNMFIEFRAARYKCMPYFDYVFLYQTPKKHFLCKLIMETHD
jgi:hypothetical protein